MEKSVTFAKAYFKFRDESKYLMIASAKNWDAPIHIKPLFDKHNRHVGYEHIKNAIHDRKKFGNGNWKYDVFKRKSLMDKLVSKESNSAIYFENPDKLRPYDKFIIGSKRSILLEAEGPEITKDICLKFRKKFPDSPLFENGEKYPYGSSKGASQTLMPRSEEETLFLLKLVGIDLAKIKPLQRRVSNAKRDKCGKKASGCSRHKPRSIC